MTFRGDQRIERSPAQERNGSYIGAMARLSLEHLVSLEHQGWMALCESRGASFYGDTMTEDGLMVLANGMVLDRDAVVATLDESKTWDSYEIMEPRLVPFGRKAAALVYRAEARRDEGTFEAFMTSVYHIAKGEPRLALHQQTTILH